MNESARIEEGQKRVTELFESNFGFGRYTPQSHVEPFEELRKLNVRDRKRLDRKRRSPVKKKVIIAGGRDFVNITAGFRKISRLIGKISDNPQEEVEIIEGGAMGADKVGALWANENGITLNTMSADWNTHGKAAGMIRNREMAEVGTHLIAFWDGVSRGTKNMIDEARKKGLKVAIVWYYTETDDQGHTKVIMGRKDA